MAYGPTKSRFELQAGESRDGNFIAIFAPSTSFFEQRNNLGQHFKPTSSTTALSNLDFGVITIMCLSCA